MESILLGIQGFSVRVRHENQTDMYREITEKYQNILSDVYDVTHTQLKFSNSGRVNSFHDVILFPLNCCSQLLFHQVYTFIVRRRQMPIWCFLLLFSLRTLT